MQEKKSFNVRISKDLWMFLKLESARQGTSMIHLIENCLIRMKNKIDKKALTSKNADV